MEGYKIEEFFKDKKITLMGLGLLGRGVGDAEFLAQFGADVLVTDLKTEEELAESVSRLKKYPNIKFKLGEHNINDFTNCDMVIKSAGVPLNSLYIEKAKEAGVPVEMSTALFVRLSGVKTVGVTGTRGKSTTTHLIYEILKEAEEDVILGGNVQGISTLSMLPNVNKNTIAILELDSWQLQGFGESEISPSISVFTNFYPDHLNYYDTIGLYFADKANVFKYQKEGDVLIIGEQVTREIKERGYTPPSKVIEVEAVDIVEKANLKIKGNHNKKNANFAACAVEALGIKEDIIESVLEKFEGVEGRMQKIDEIKGHEIYNDTTSTTPEALSVALETLSKDRKIVLIAGGYDKGLDMQKAASAINKYCSFVSFLRGTGTERFLNEYKIEVSFKVFDNLEETLDKAIKEAQKNEPIILSPGFASFGIFKNEFDRGEKFKKLVEAAKNSGIFNNE